MSRLFENFGRETSIERERTKVACSSAHTRPLFLSPRGLEVRHASRHTSDDQGNRVGVDLGS